jgi:PKD repeat protein
MSHSAVLGNYWGSAYTGTDTDNNGIGDTGFTVPNSLGTDAAPLMGTWQDGTISAGPDSVAPVAGFTANTNSGQAPCTVTFTSWITNGGTVTSYAWDFNNDGIVDSTVQNPSYTYTTRGKYTVNLTVTGPGGSTSVVKTNYITMTSPSADLTVAAGPTSSSSPSPNLFAHYTANTVSATVRNLGSLSAGPFNVSFNVGGTVLETNVSELAAGASTVVSVTDTADRSVGASIPITVTADPENTLEETKEDNNQYSYTATVISNGYAGMRWSDGSDITTKTATTLHGDIVSSLGTSRYGSGSAAWTASDLPIPAGATVKNARLYITYCWDSNHVMPGAAVTSFNGVTKSYDTFYSDDKNWGGWSYPFGLITYNVTDQFNPAGNSVSATGIPPIRGMELVVTYEDPNATEKQIFVNEGFDLLYASPAYYTTEETATAYAPFTGAAIDMSRVNNATLTTFVNRGASGDTRGTMLFNGHEWPNYWVKTGFAEIGVGKENVTSYLTATGNTAGFRSLVANNMDMEPHLAILKIEYRNKTPTVPGVTANFYAFGHVGQSPYSVRFLDQSTGSPTTWKWDFGDNTTSTEQNPTHVFNQTGAYNVALTASNDQSSDTAIQYRCVIVNTVPVANFTANATAGRTPFTVQFTDESTGATSYQWQFGDGATSTEQNPVHTYTTPGSYTVTLVASSADYGSVYTQKPGYITVTNPPTVGFSANVTAGLAPLAVQFNESVNGSVQYYYWQFGDGATSFDQAPIHVYTNAGIYTVSLYAIGSNGTELKTIENYINVTSSVAPTTTITPVPTNTTTTMTPMPTSSGHDLPVANFTVTSQGGQGSMGILVTDASMNATSVKYDLGDGTTTGYPNFRYTYWQAGTYTITLTATNSAGSSTKSLSVTVPAAPSTTSTTVSPTVTSPTTPIPTTTVAPTNTATAPVYNGPHTIPGILQAEDYDLGGEGVAYHDTTAGNEGGVYRHDDVDIEQIDTDGSPNVGWTRTGEWMTYTVNVVNAGTYTAGFRVGSSHAGSSVQAYLDDGTTPIATVNVPNTGNSGAFQTVAVPVTLPAGQHRLVLKFPTDYTNINWIAFA